MTSQSSYAHFDLPDPVSQPGFYRDVPAKRALAFVIDSVAIFLISVVILPLTGFLGLFIFGFLMAAVGFVYRVATISGQSATWGMRLMAIEFRARSGARFDTSDAFFHTVGLMISFAVFPLQLISVVMMLVTDRGQGLTDLLMGSVALNRRG